MIPREERIGREVAILYGITLAVTLGLTLAQGAVGWIRGYITTIVAFTFIFLPMELLKRRDLEPRDFGIHFEGRRRALLNFLAVSAIVFPLYAVGYHVWQTQWLDRDLDVASARYDKWPAQVQEPPRIKQPALGDVWLFSANDRVWLQWRLPLGQTFAADISSDGALKAVGSGTRPPSKPGTVEIRGRTAGRVALTVGGERLTLSIRAAGEQLPPERLRLGTALVRADDNPITVDRSLRWLFDLIMLQLLLVALPEELFYRGYLQTRLDGLVGRDRTVLGVEVNVASVVLTSALFALGHIITIWHPARLAVFFPSLLFGWMRRATNGILAPILFHAACNMLVDILSLHYR